MRGPAPRGVAHLSAASEEDSKFVVLFRQSYPALKFAKPVALMTQSYPFALTRGWTLLVVAVDAFSLGCQPGSYESAPCVAWSVLGSPPLELVPPLPGGRRPLTHSPRREVVS